MFKSKIIPSILLSVLLVQASCKKDSPAIKEENIELNIRLDNMYNLLSKMETDTKVLEKKNILNINDLKKLESFHTELSSFVKSFELPISNDQLVLTLNNLILSKESLKEIEFSEDYKNTLDNFGKFLKNKKTEDDLLNGNLKEFNVHIVSLALDLRAFANISLQPTLDTPIEFKVSQGEFKGKINISWLSVPLAKNYQLERYNDILQKYEIVYEGSESKFLDTYTGQAYQKVFYRIRAFNNNTKFSAYSAVSYGYTTTENYRFSHQFGYEGTSQEYFGLILHGNINKDDILYLSDDYQNRIKKFDLNGNFKGIVMSLNSPRGITFLTNGNTIITSTQTTSYVKVLNSNYSILSEWGTYGTSDTQFQNIEQVTSDKEDNIYILDGIGNKVRKYNKSGQLLLSFNATIRSENQVSAKASPYGICYLNNKIFVGSSYHGIIRVYDESGTFLYQWNSNLPSINTMTTDGKFVYFAGSDIIIKSDEKGEITERIGATNLLGKSLYALCITKDGSIVASAAYDRKIMVFKKL